jgi:small GTP-binding protein
MSDDKAIKIILLGEAGVGKTNLIRVAIGKEFDPNAQSTLTSSYCESQIEVNNKKYRYFLWDTAGQETYRSLNKLFIKDSKIVLIVFAINDKESYNQVDYWLKSVKELLGNEGYIVGLVGNKSDLYEEEAVKPQEIESKAKEMKVKFKVTSAYTDSKGFKSFLDEILQQYINQFNPEEYTGKKRKNSLKIDNSQKDVPEKKKCC